MDFDYLKKGIVQLIKKAEIEIPKDVVIALKKAYDIEEGIAKIQVGAILENIKLAKETMRPVCQDTGIQTFFIEVGFDFPYIHRLKDVITEAVREATLEIPLRPNTVDLLTRKNTGDNTGRYIPHITWDFFDGREAIIIAFPKGGGSENMCKLGMLKPGVGIEGIKDFIVEEMIKAGGNPCPPTVVGVGIGGTADLSMKLSKKALLRPVGFRNKNRIIAKIEEELIERINSSGIGPMGLGGRTTVLDVHLEVAHRHPATLPVGISVQCWANRRARMIVNSKGEWRIE